jgi:hypothetical protein
MAQHTGRNVVSIPLARIETNQELMDIVFDQSFAVKVPSFFPPPLSLPRDECGRRERTCR